MIKILCYGDSNTWGFNPAVQHQRFAEAIYEQIKTILPLNEEKMSRPKG